MKYLSRLLLLLVFVFAFIPQVVHGDTGPSTVTTDFYSALMNANGTVRFVDKAGKTIADNAPSYFLDYGSPSTVDVSPANSSFEQANASGILAGWDLNRWYIQQSRDYASEGQYSLEFNSTTADNDQRRAYSAPIPCRPDKKYQVQIDSLYGTFTSGAQQADIILTYYQSADGTGPSSNGVDIRVPTAPGKWVTNAFTWVPDFKARSFRILLYVDNTEISTLYFDNLRILEATSNYQTNPAAAQTSISTSGDTVTIDTKDSSSPDVSISGRYVLNLHSPLVTFSSSITYKKNVSVSEERYDFLVPVQPVSIMTRDLKLVQADPAQEYYSDALTPRVAKLAGGLSFTGDDSAQAMRLTPVDGGIRLSFFVDYYLNHPFAYSVKNGYRLEVDLSRQRQPAGTSHDIRLSFFVQPGVAPKALVKTRQPNGYRAALVLTNHADYEMLAPNLAVGYGTEDTRSPNFGTKGILGRGLNWTKSVFLLGKGPPFVDLSDPAFKSLTDRMSRDGAEIIPHGMADGTVTRPQMQEGLKLFQQYASRNWIDHHAIGGIDNWQDLTSQGTIVGDPNYSLDLLAKYGYQYAWSYDDIIPANQGLNLLSPSSPAVIAPFLYYNRNVDDQPGQDKPIYLWSTMDTQLRPDFFYTSARVDDLIAQRGVHIGHEYLTGPAAQGHAWDINPATGKAEILPAFDNELANIAAEQKAGLLWVPTMSQLGDYLVSLKDVSIATNADGTYTVANRGMNTVNGLTLLAESPIYSVSLDGAANTVFGGPLGMDQIVLPTLPAGKSVRLAVKLLPSASTGQASSVGFTSATLNGSVGDFGTASSVKAWFDWGTTEAYGNSTPPQTVSTASPVKAIISGLAPGVAYHFRLKVDGSASGAVAGNDIQFASVPAGAFLTLEQNHDANDISGVGAYAAQTFTPRLSHTVTAVRLKLANRGAAGGSLTVGIRATDAAGLPAGPLLASSVPLAEASIGFDPSTYEFDLRGGFLVNAGVTYAISLGATSDGLFVSMSTAGSYAGGFYLSSANGTAWNDHNRTYQAWFEEAGITKGPSAPTVVTGDATAVTASSAMLSGILGDTGSLGDFSVGFQYGPSGAYGSSTTTRFLKASGPFTITLEGLQPGTTYHYRASLVGNPPAFGVDRTFTTGPALATSTSVGPSSTATSASGGPTTAASGGGTTTTPKGGVITGNRKSVGRGGTILFGMFGILVALTGFVVATGFRRQGAETPAIDR